MNTNNGWLDIASAPKDFSTEFDGWNGERVPNVIWAHPEYGLKGEYAWCRSVYEPHHGWSMERVKGLTHWMPLPAAPGSPAETPAYTVTVDPDPRGVSVGVYQGSSCVYHGAHAIPAGSGPERDWELSCDACNGAGHVFVERQVAERKTDVQEFKEECEECDGRGFTIAFQDIPGIAEYVKSCRPASTVADEGAKDWRGAFDVWYGRRGAWPRLTYEEIFSAGWNARPAPAAGDAQIDRDAAFEAVRKRLCAIPRYSFCLDDDGVVRRVEGCSGNWIEFDAAHELFDPVCVDAAIAASQQGGE